MKLIAAQDLKRILDSARPPLVLSLETEEVFAAGHLAGSLRVALYEMGFVERVEALLPQKDAPIVLYVMDTGSHGPAFAAEKLERAGYTAIHALQGGLDAWRAKGFAVVAKAVQPRQAVVDSGTFRVDFDSSRLRWVGRNLANLHEGTVGLSKGFVVLNEGELKSGQLTLDMRAIRCSDIADTKLNRLLIKHLEDHDFFDVERYPEAEVRLGRVTRRKDVALGQPNYVGEAILTLRGVEHGVSFELVGGLSGDQFSLQGALKFDRTDWGVLYGSGRFFKNLGMHLVNDLVDLDIRLNFKRPA